MAPGRCRNEHTGQPKVRYLDLDSAQLAAEEVNRKNRDRGWVRKPVGPYPCLIHGWHIGRPPDVPSSPTVKWEIGERAWSNLKAENQSDRPRRRRVLLERMLRADARRCTLEDDRPGRTTGTPTAGNTGSGRTGTAQTSR